MKSLWSDSDAASLGDDPLKMRVYTSRLIGQDSDLVLHGGGNTSVKATTVNFFGDEEEVLYVKGSGWDLATIEAPGFSPVKMSALNRLASFLELTDTDMVREQRSAMLNPEAPNPSVEAILHALIPYKFVDHTHADAVVTVTNTPDGLERVKEVWGDRVLVIPYVMPGFVLAKKVFELTQGIDWDQYEGMILMNHGIFTFANDGKTSYERMIQLVDEAEEHIRKNNSWDIQKSSEAKENLIQLAQLRSEASSAAGFPMIARLKANSEAVGFSNIPNVSEIATRGPLTPDHVIRTKRIPLMVSGNLPDQFKAYQKEYESYFEANTDGNLTVLDKAPRWAVWPNHGVVGFGKTLKDADIVNDITGHTLRSIQWAESLGGWRALDAKEIFDVEYWELEQAKLKKSKSSLSFQGKIALVTGGASGIGKACVESLKSQGAVVVALDLNDDVVDQFSGPGYLGVVCDVTDSKKVSEAIDLTVRHFGGLDIVVSSAGMFPSSMKISDMEEASWSKSLDLNLSSHQRLLKLCIPYLKHGVDPAVIIIGSKNVPAPGPGASAYSVAKAGLNQLARVAALELAEYGIRINTIHPNAVFDTGIWTEDVLKSRAKSYGLTVDEYKKNNLLKVEVSSENVAALACAMAGPIFAKTTGAQVPIDGGNERVI